MGKFKDLTGQRFGRWVVLRVMHIRAREDSPATTWLCRCDCSTEAEVIGTSLTRGRSTSCGCKTVERCKTHGLSKHYLYDTWSGIVSRTTNEFDDAYDRYGGRQIDVEPEWLDSPTEFIKWVDANLGPRPSSKHSIDRIRNDKGYLKSNIKWSDDIEQSRNKRSNHLVTFKGAILTLSEWSERVGVKASTIRARLKAGWSEERALSTPTNRRPKEDTQEPLAA